jgi:hypothetical protein
MVCTAVDHGDKAGVQDQEARECGRTNGGWERVDKQEKQEEREPYENDGSCPVLTAPESTPPVLQPTSRLAARSDGSASRQVLDSDLPVSTGGRIRSAQ